MTHSRRLPLSTILMTFVVGCATPVGVHTLDRRSVRQVLTADAVSEELPSITSRQVLLRLGLFERYQRDP